MPVERPINRMESFSGYFAMQAERALGLRHSHVFQHAGICSARDDQFDPYVSPDARNSTTPRSIDRCKKRMDTYPFSIEAAVMAFLINNYLHSMVELRCVAERSKNSSVVEARRMLCIDSGKVSQKA